jgi:antitoxin HicB
MFDHLYVYPARLEAQPDGSFVVSFPDLPEALTDGDGLGNALSHASDCLSEALAGRISNDESIPAPGAGRTGLHIVAPEPTVALKAALYSALRERGLTVADLARRLDIDYRQAARLIDPRSPSKLTTLKAALDALGYEVAIAVQEKPAA